MRSLKREERGVFYAKYAGKEQITDEFGNLTGEWRVTYGKPELVIATVSPRNGNTWGDGFGIGVDCDRTMIVDEIATGIDETCILWVDIRPQLDDEGNLVLDEDGLPVTPNDYKVVMAGESYNFTNIAIKKAE